MTKGLLRPFRIMFFLADDTMEISEQYPLNCGRWQSQLKISTCLDRASI